MKVIGIDPGIERVGVGIVEYVHQQYKIIHYQLIKTSRNNCQSIRLQSIYRQLEEILLKYPVDAASVEKLFFAKNIKTALNVAEARGVIQLALQNKKIPVYEYTPLQLKQAIIGYGRAGKNKIQEYVKIMLRLKETPKPDDVADGLALSIIHINSYKTLSKIKPT